MTILTPEVRALLKRMDADDAIDKAIELALEAAAKVCRAERERFGRLRHGTDYADGREDCANFLEMQILGLKEQK